MATTISIDFDTGAIAALERQGDCNGCGNCCRLLIHYDIQDETPVSGKWTLLASGQWYRHKSMVRDAGNCQHLTAENRCAVHDMLLLKYPLCQEFPFTPDQIIEDCSYTFVELS